MFGKGAMGESVENEAPPDKITHAGQRAFLKAYAETGNVKRSCFCARIHRRTHYDWLRDDPQYAEAFEDAKEDAADKLESLAVRQAQRGSSDMTKFLLQGLRPEKYRAITEHRHTGAGGGPIQIDTRSIGRLIMSSPATLEAALKLADMIQAAAFPEASGAPETPINLIPAVQTPSTAPNPTSVNGHLNGHANGTLNGDAHP